VKVSLIYDGYGAQWGNHGAFDADQICDAAHGLSGTELQIFGQAAKLAESGLDVTVFSRFEKDTGGIVGRLPRTGVIRFTDLDNRAEQPCDVAIAYHDARRLDGWPAKEKVAYHQTFLVSNRQQDATFTGADFADIYITATDHVARHLECAYSWPKVHVVPNAWDLGTFHPWQPVPGRLVYTTSLERGFHRLLEALPLIRERVPEAHVVAFARGGPAVDAFRKNPVEGVELIQASSLNEVLRVVATAACFAYPCDVSAPTEVFPVSLLQACATGVPCVLAPDDSLEELFAPAVMLSSSVKQNPSYWRDDFVGRVCSVLTQPEVASYWSARGKDWAQQFKFSETTKRLAKIVGLA
jgi:glycosyltransferase involved in cell wall biosynthesis